MQKKVIIIGAGIGGMASAIRLRLQGFEVDVFEKNAYVGGKLSWFQQQGYSFDEGPSLFTQPAHIEALFQLAGEDINNYFNYVRVPIACTYFFENGKRVEADAEIEKFAQNMQEQLGEEAANVIEYLAQSERLYTRIGHLFLKYSLHRPFDFSWMEIWKALRTVKLPYLFGTLNSYNKASFSTPEAAQLFNRYATYNGSNPYKAPGMLSLIPHLEMNEGTFYPKGGMISITYALYKLALKVGVSFHLNTPVEQILHEQGKVKGVVVRGAVIPAQIVVSNVDVYFTYKNLLGDIAKSKKILQQERSSSALIFYWGVRKSFHMLGLHNIFFSKNYAEEFAHIFEKGTLFEDPTVYINITAKMEEGHAPNGCENWFVMINVPANKGHNWEALKQEARKYILAKLSRMLGANVEPHLETEAILDPVTIELKTASYMGSLYGTSSNSKFAAFIRHPNFSKQIAGLYFVGGSAHPGGGIPLCLRSAAIMSDLVAKSKGSC